MTVVEENHTFTAKEERFIDEYLIDLDPERAALTAGYSASVARTKAYRWVSNSQQNEKLHVKLEIDRRIRRRAERTEITQDNVLKELALIAFADMKDYIEILDDGSVQAKTWDQMPEGASRAVCEVREVRRIMTAGKGKGEEVLLECRIGYRHYDKLRALELLGNHLGIWKNKTEVLFPDVETFELPKLKTPGK
jgi:phage terminase small subunit